MFVDWLRRDIDLLTEYCVGTGVVVSNGMQRGLMTAVLWFVPSPAPIEVCGSVAEAEELVRGLLAESS